MLKGHSTIELTDVKTGKVERYEDDNLVTNGIKYYQRFYGLPTVVWKEVFTGVKIFEENITEDPNMVVAPLAANMIGYACDYSDTTDNMRGILNLDQSGLLEDGSGIKLTWDFAQNQANGTIKCICLTPKDSARYPRREIEEYNRIICANVSTNSVKRPIDYDYSKRTVISCFASLKSENRMVFSLNRTPFIYSGITDDGTGKLLGNFEVNVPGDFSEYVTDGTYIGTYENFYYFMAIKSFSANKPATTTFLLVKIKRGTYEVETQEFSFSDPAYPDVYFDTLVSTGSYYAFVFNGGIYICKSNRAYKFKMQDYTLEKVLDLKLPSQGFFAVSKHNVIGNDFTIDENDNIRNGSSTFYKNVGSQYGVPRGVLFELVPDVIFAGCYTATNYKDDLYILRAPIIITINNLTTPVTKTADKTMKITYILKEVYPETAP